MVWKTKIVNKLSLIEIFCGAFLSSVLTFVSFGFFLRLGTILSLSGLHLLSLVCLFSLLICGLTAFSIAWMLSNIKAENDSLHFLLSRTFGVDIAFSVCTPLFISQALSASFYILGITQVLNAFYPFLNTSMCVFCLFIFFGFLSALKSNYLVKSEIFLFVLVLGCLTTIFFNPLLIKPSISYSRPCVNFWQSFALFFPLITGIESCFVGSQSEKFCPKMYSLGVNFGLITSFIIYFGMMYLLYHNIELDVLTHNALAFTTVSTFPQFCLITLISLGAFAAINSLSCATLTIKSLIKEAPLSDLFKKNSCALFFSLIVAGLGLFFGSLSTLSPFLTLFFLISYGMINMATGLEAWIGNPSWRPVLSGHYLISIFGALACFITILMISPGFGLISCVLIIILYFFIRKLKTTTSWDDFRYSLLLFIAKSSIYKLNQLVASPKTWRPNLLVFIGDPLLRVHLTQFSCDLTHKKGFLTFASIVADATFQAYENKKIHLFLEKKQIPGLVKVKAAPSLLEGMRSLIENMGFGTLSPNTIVLGASEKQEKAILLSELIIQIHRSKLNLVLIKESSLQTPTEYKSVHLWWGAKNRVNSELMIIFSHMLKKSSTWKKAKIILKTVVNHKEDIDTVQKKLLALVQQSRVFFDTKIILHDHGDIFSKTIQKHALTADVVFLGLRAPDLHETSESYATYYTSLMEKTRNYPAIAFVLAGESLDFDKILF